MTAISSTPSGLLTDDTFCGEALMVSFRTLNCLKVVRDTAPGAVLQCGVMHRMVLELWCTPLHHLSSYTPKFFEILLKSFNFHCFQHDGSVYNSSSIPNVSMCFQHTILVYVPALFFWVLFPAFLLQSRRLQQSGRFLPLPLSPLYVIKAVIAVLLFGDAIFIFSRHFVDSPSPPVNWIYPIILALTAVSILERSLRFYSNIFRPVCCFVISSRNELVSFPRVLSSIPIWFSHLRVLQNCTNGFSAPRMPRFLLRMGETLAFMFGGSDA